MHGLPARLGFQVIRASRTSPVRHLTEVRNALFAHPEARSFACAAVSPLFHRRDRPAPIKVNAVLLRAPITTAGDAAGPRNASGEWSQ